MPTLLPGAVLLLLLLSASPACCTLAASETATAAAAAQSSTTAATAAADELLASHRAHLDRNGDGRVSENEAIEVLHRDLDYDKSGNIDPGESARFLRHLGDIDSATLNNRLAVFHSFDMDANDGNDFISVKELQNAWNNSASALAAQSGAAGPAPGVA